MMGAAMLKRHRFVQSLWALYRLVVSSITWGSQAQRDGPEPLSLSLSLSISTNSNTLKITFLGTKPSYFPKYIF